MPLFLDFNLDDGKTARDYIPQLRHLGFDNIVLVTSHMDLAENDFVGSKAIIGKDPEMALRFLVPPAAKPVETLLDLA